MITKQEFEFIKERVFETLKFSYSGEIELAEAVGAYVKICSDKCIIGASEKILCARSLMLMVQHISEVGFEVLQKPQFTMTGVMLDVSRGAVMRVSVLRKYMDYMACFGVNTLLMYMEDVFEVKEYPMFGYMRGRYTAEELREVDDYAEKLGIEVIPCIQTLSHMATYLKWNESKDFRTSGSTLLCDNEKTFEFIEALIKTMRACFRTKRIHIGMDEAYDFCDGKYKELHGECDKFEVLLRHLNNVTDICKKYEFKPIIWDDMFFRLGSKTGEYYDVNSVIPEEVKTKIPDIDLVYWDYDRDNADMYEKLMNAHLSMGKNVIYAGSFWTHVIGHLPVTKNVFDTFYLGLAAAKKTGIKEVMTCLWGDDGTQCNFFLTLPYLAMLGETCYNSENHTKESIEKSAEFVTGVDFEAMHAMSEYHAPYDNCNNELWYRGMGKRLFYTDLLYNLTGETDLFKTLVNNYENGYNTMKRLAEKGGAWEGFYTYSRNIFRILKLKAEIINEIRNEYSAKNMEYFKNLADNIFPELTELYKKVYKQAENIWMYTNKAFGWETISARYGRMIIRMEYYTKVIQKFAYGETDKIEELDFEYIGWEAGFREWTPLYVENRNIAITG